MSLINILDLLDRSNLASAKAAFHAAGYDVHFLSGADERFDLLLVAEGRSSRAGRILFADETEYRDFSVSITYGTPRQNRKVHVGSRPH